jgi:hypothetical protein
MYSINNTCYKFKKIIFNKGFLDESVDATYIIHLENNGRLESIYNQLKQYIPTKIVYILFNKGYKKCKKSEYVIDTGYDLIDSFITIFKDSKNKNYNNILILEDDFFFDIKIKDKKICDNINNFIINRKNKSYLYILGCIPTLSTYYNDHTSIVFLKMGTHAIIYSKKLIDNVLEKKQINVDDWDTFTNLKCIKYMYNEPLCYQLFPTTENSIVCAKKYYILGKITKCINKTLSLDKKTSPGYPFFYIFSKILFFIIIIILFLIIYFIYKYMRTNKKKSKK